MHTDQAELTEVKPRTPFTGIPFVVWLVIIAIATLFAYKLIGAIDPPFLLTWNEEHPLYLFHVTETFVRSHIPTIILFFGLVCMVVFGLQNQRVKLRWLFVITLFGYLVLTFALFLSESILDLVVPFSMSYKLEDPEIGILFLLFILRYLVWLLVFAITVCISLRRSAVKRTGWKLLGSIALMLAIVLIFSRLDFAAATGALEQHSTVALALTPPTLHGFLTEAYAIELTLLCGSCAWILFDLKPLSKV